MTHDQAPDVQLLGVGKQYGHKRAVADISLQVPGGGFLVLLGPSGSGKSTLLRLVAGTERVTSGSISIGGTVVGDAREHVPPERRDLAMVFQDYALWPHLTVSANVAFALRRQRVRGRAATDRVDEILRRLGLDHLAARYPGELSGGEQQRVALARALVAKPRLILFDEPLSNLDADLRERLRFEIATLTRDSGATAIYITHDQGEAFALADQIGVLREGALIQLAAPEEIYARPSAPFVARFTGIAGELIGRVAPGALSTAPSVLVDRVGNLQVVSPQGSLGPPGSRVRVLLRPGAISLVTSSLVTSSLVASSLVEGSTEAPSGQSHSSVVGIVRDVAFRGRWYEHAVEVGGTCLLAGVLAEDRHERGAHVGLILDRAGCLAFAEPLEAPTDATSRAEGSVAAAAPGPFGDDTCSPSLTPG